MTPPAEIPSAVPRTILDLVSYQEASVVSRIVLKREKGNITIFAFDVGQGLSEHTSPFDALAQIVDGEAEISISGKPILVKTGEIVLLPAGEPHALKAIVRFKMLLTMIRS
jgi:quercetin dioxygenase-like cupin family protein